MKEGILNILNIYINGHRTSVKLTDTQLSIARELAMFRNMKLNKYLVLLIKTGKDIDKGYGISMAIRDGIIMELYTLLTTNLKKKRGLN